MHFGNPFSTQNYSHVKMVLPTIEDSVKAFEQWLRGEDYQYIDPQRRKWILDQINSGELYGKPIVYYTDYILDTDGVTKKYDYETFPNHAHILLKLINEQHDTGENIGQQSYDAQTEQNEQSASLANTETYNGPVYGSSDQNLISLTTEQQDVVNEAAAFIAKRLLGQPEVDGKKYICISGMAGTGKTTVVRYIMKQLVETMGGRKPRTCVATVSRQAVGVLHQKVKNLIPKTETVYSLSGTSEKDSEVEFKIDPKKNKVNEYNLIFIDEASMVDDGKFKVFDEYTEQANTVIVYIGDYGQARPIGS